MAMVDSPRLAFPGHRPLDLFTRPEPAFAATGLFMLALMAPTLFAALVDERSFQGVNVWIKPLKFEFSLAVWFLTLAFFARWLPEGLRERRWYGIFATAVVVAAVVEIAWIGTAAAMGTASHFNETPLGSAIYPMMGAAAALITSASAVYAYQIARNDQAALPPALKEGLVLGLALTLPLTLLTAGAMSAMGAHWVGGPATDAGSLPLMGWSRQGGDLRVAHFFATHAMHFVPAFALVSASTFGAAERRPVRLFSALFCGLVLFTFAQALLGQPFMPRIG